MARQITVDTHAMPARERFCECRSYRRWYRMEPGNRRMRVGVPADAGGTDMETSIPMTTLAVREVLFSPEEYVTWCTEQHRAIFGARRADIEGFGRHLEALGNRSGQRGWPGSGT